MKDIIERCERMKLGAQANLDIGNDYYVMHARCAVEFANDVMETLGRFPQIYKEHVVEGCLWHVFKATSELGKTSYRVRHTTWESYVVNVITHGNNGLFFIHKDDAIKIASTLNEKIKRGNA